MHVELRMESTGIAFLPGLAQPKTIDSGDLSAEELAEMANLIQAVDFFKLPAAIGPPPGAADYRQYAISVEDGGRSHTVRLADPVDDPGLQALLDFLKRVTSAR